MRTLKHTHSHTHIHTPDSWEGKTIIIIIIILCLLSRQCHVDWKWQLWKSKNICGVSTSGCFSCDFALSYIIGASSQANMLLLWSEVFAWEQSPGKPFTWSNILHEQITPLSTPTSKNLHPSESLKVQFFFSLSLRPHTFTSFSTVSLYVGFLHTESKQWKEP